MCVILPDNKLWVVRWHYW